MSRIRFALIVVPVCSLAMSIVGHGQRLAVPEPACVFPESEEITKPIVAGPDSIVKRVEFFQPKDAPIHIVRADFTGATLTIGGFFRFTHNYTLEVVNVSDQIASSIHWFVWALSGNAGGADAGGGHGPTDRTPLEPGQRRVLRTEGAVTEDRMPFGDDVRIQVGVTWVKFDTCTWNRIRAQWPHFVRIAPSSSAEP